MIIHMQNKTIFLDISHSIFYNANKKKKRVSNNLNLFQNDFN